MARKHPRKAGKLTFEHVFGLAKAASMGGGFARDPSGAVLPWALMTLDRLDSEKGRYADGEVRILCEGLNRVRLSRAPREDVDGVSEVTSITSGKRQSLTRSRKSYNHVQKRDAFNYGETEDREEGGETYRSWPCSQTACAEGEV